MISSDVSDLLRVVQPTKGQILKLFGALGKVDPDILQLLICSLDPQTLRRVSEWSMAFINDLNQIRFDQADNADLVITPDFDADFFEAMKRTQYIGRQLTESDLQMASNIMTKAIKAENWVQAIWTGVSIARFLGL